MKFWIHAVFYTVLAIVATGCAGKGVMPAASTPKIKSDLPIVSSIRTIATITTVGLEWKMVPSTQIEGYRIYRRTLGAKKKKLTRIAEVKDRYSTHFVDMKLEPGRVYVYQMATYDKDGFESRQSNPVKVTTSPMIHSVSFVRAITNLPHRIKLIWRPHQDPRVVGYVIERAPVNMPEKWQEIAQIKGRLNAEFMDKNLGDGEVYMYRIRVKLCNGLLSEPSQAVKAITKPLPLPPQDLKVSNGLPRMIRLEWKPSSTKDVVYYKVYRAPFVIGFYAYRAKVRGHSFEDRIDGDGKSYYYKVTAVDKDGLESKMPPSPMIGSTLPKPETPIVTSAKIAFNQAIITWKPTDRRADHYRIIRSYWEGLKKRKELFSNIRETRFVDKKMVPGINYRYQVVEVDRYGILSQPSKGVELYLPKEGK